MKAEVPRSYTILMGFFQNEWQPEKHKLKYGKETLQCVERVMAGRCMQSRRERWQVTKTCTHGRGTGTFHFRHMQPCTDILTRSEWMETRN